MRPIATTASRLAAPTVIVLACGLLCTTPVAGAAMTEVAGPSAGTARAAAPHAAPGPPANGPAPKSDRITFFFGLKRPEALARAAFFAVQRPGSASYRRFMTLRRVSDRYGASRATRRAFVADIARLGLRARIDPSGVFARVSGRVGRFERGFHTTIFRVFGNAPNVLTYSVRRNKPLPLPADLRPLVDDVVAVYAHSATPSGKPTAAAAGAGAARSTASATAKPRNTGTWTRGCAKARKTGAFSYEQLRRAYGLDRVGSGRGASIAILNVGEGVLGADIADDARCFGYPKLRVRTLRTDGQAHAFGRSTFEPAEDVDVARGIAPGLRSMEFTQVWLSPELWFLGVSQVLDGGRLPDSLSISYGECERSIRGRGSTPATRAGADLMDSELVRLGLAGVGAYSAAGDEGSTCAGLPFRGVAWPASSPYLTAVGGTRLTLDRANRRTGEVAWNDLRWLSPSNGGGATGGGYSMISPRPPFQRGLRVPGRRRTVPDVAAAASNLPGYPVVFAGNWVVDGGTSAATPLIASAMAILGANQQRRGRPPIGPANGLFYGMRKRSPQTFQDIVKGNNRFRKRVAGFRAKRGYDLTTGLGVPRFAALASRLPAPG
jgi:subtilase family serine protease